MLKRFLAIPDVKQIAVSKSKLFRLQKNTNLYLEDTLYKSQVNVISEIDYSGYLLLSIGNENIILDVANRREENAGNLIPQFLIGNNKFLSLKYAVDFSSKDIHIFNYMEHQTELLIDNFEGGVKLFKDDVIYSQADTSTIFAFSIIAKSKIWENNLIRDGVIVKILGVTQNNIWVTSRNGNETHRLTGLEVNTGAVNYIGEEFQIKYAYTSELFETGNILGMYGFSRFEPETEYKEFDGSTGKIIRQGVIEPLLKENLVLKDWAKYGDKIYFTAIKEEKFPTHIGVLDYETLNLLDYTKVDTTPGHFLPAGNAPVVNDGKLYILDGGGTLHIYNYK